MIQLDQLVLILLVMLCSTLSFSRRAAKYNFLTRRRFLVASSTCIQQTAGSIDVEPASSFTPPPLHYTELPDETIYVLDATSMLVTSYFSREVAAEYAGVTAKFRSRPDEELSCGALVGLAMVCTVMITPTSVYNSRLSPSLPFPLLPFPSRHEINPFAQHFSRLIRDLRPRYIVAAFDVGRYTFRNELYDEYKAQRDGLPEDLVHQFEYAIPVLQSLGCMCIQKQGYEADDVLVNKNSYLSSTFSVCMN